MHEATKRGAWDNIRALVFGLYISSASDEGDLMSARGMAAISEAKVAELLGYVTSILSGMESGEFLIFSPLLLSESTYTLRNLIVPYRASQ